MAEDIGEAGGLDTAPEPPANRHPDGPSLGVVHLTHPRPNLLASQYGAFDPQSGEYVITDIHTPTPWTNVLANERYGVIVSQAGGGFSWLENCQLFRLNRWDQDLVSDAQGRFLYIQDVDDPSRLWSTTYQPTGVAALEEVRHGLGASVFTRTVHGIRSVQAMFVPTEDSCELWTVTLENVGDQRRRLRVASYLEWHLGAVGDSHREFHRLFVETEAVGETLLAWKHPGLKEHKREVVGNSSVAFVSVRGAGPVEWTTDKRSFLGRQGSVSVPDLASKGRSTGRWDDPVAAALASVDLAPGEVRSFVVTIGAAHDRNGAIALASKYDLEKATAALRETREYWSARCGGLALKTAEPALDLMVNRWLPYQAICGRMLAKCGYYQQSGAYGYRDQLQDSLLFLATEPQSTLRQIIRHAEAMYVDGGVRHWWHPNTAIFSESHHSDAGLWLPFATSAYLDETGDAGALDLPCGYLDRHTQGPSGQGSLREHCVKAIDRVLERRSDRGLPLIAAGDWNDGLSHAGVDGKGESVWLAMFLYHILRGFHEFLPSPDAYLRAAEQLKLAVNEHGWDGEWFLAGYRDDGQPFGSVACDEGQIFLNPQTWAVISEVAPQERIDSALNAVRNRLLKPYGALLLTPAYTRVDPYIGYITRYAPGLRENGGVYSHASCWAIQAFAMTGDTQTALSICRGMCPPLRSEECAERYAAEPYVTPGNVDGPDSPNEGRGGWTWYTGSAAWLRRMPIEWLCGVRAERAGLRVDARLPEGLPAYRLLRPFRGDVFDIRVSGTANTLLSGPGTGERIIVDLT